MNTQFDPNQPRSGHPNPIGSPAEDPMSATEARQGRTGFPVLKVLIAGLVLAFLAWGATEPPAEQTATPPAGNTTPATQDPQPTADPADAPAPSTGAAPAN